MRLVCSLVVLWSVIGCSRISNKNEKPVSGPQLVAFAEEEPGIPERQVQNVGDIVLFDIGAVNQDLNPNEDLINGTVPKAEDWPASFASSQSGSGCTATLIAADVLVLAAHCVGNGRTSSISIAGKSYVGTCTHHPRYNQDPTADYALCKMAEPVDRAWYENVLVDGSKIAVGGKVTLAGAGCTQPGGGGGFGTFRIGESTIVGIPVRDNDTTTRGGAALCYGDSGGGAYWLDGVKRFLFGVNSRGDIRTTSYISSVFTKIALDWFKLWADSKAVKICGLHADAPKCQGFKEPEPPVNPLPEHCKVSYNQIFLCFYGNPRVAIAEPEACRKEIANLFACEEIAERSED